MTTQSVQCNKYNVHRHILKKMRECGIYNDQTILTKLRHTGIKCLEMYTNKDESKFVIIATNRKMTKYVAIVVCRKQQYQSVQISSPDMWNTVKTLAHDHNPFDVISILSDNSAVDKIYGNTFHEVVHVALGHIDPIFLRIYIGDTVYHKPTDTTWITRKVDNTHLWPVGLENRVYVGDCALVQRATQKEREKLLATLCGLPKCDPRHIKPEEYKRFQIAANLQ